MKKFKLLYYSILKYQHDNYQYLQDNFEVIELESPSNDSNEVLQDIDVILAPLGYLISKEKIDKCVNLKVIGSNTTGHPHIDVDYAISKKISVVTLKNEKEFLDTITPSAEFTWGLLLTLTRNIIPANQYVQKGKWDRRPFGGQSMLSRLKIGIVGLGRLGSLVSQYALAFRMEVFFYDPNIAVGPPRISKCNSLEDLVSQVDIVSLHVPHERETEGMFSKRIFNSFKKNSFFINTSRGELLDHSALLENLKNGRLSGAATDVFEGEFNPEFEKTFDSHPLLNYAKNNTNLIITPHIAGSTIDAWFETERYTIQSILNILKDDVYDYQEFIERDSVLAMIPARGGSKSVPLKNMALLNEKPLIDYAINVAKKTSMISRVICSTDSEKISNYCKDNFIEVQQRPAELSKDNVTTIDVILYLLNTILKSDKSLPEFLVLLEPTSPFVNSTHIEMCLEALKADLSASSAQTVTRASSNSHAYNQRYHDENGSHFLFLNERKKSTNKQSKPNFFIHGNVRVMRVSELMKTKKLFGKKSIPIEISRFYSMDVDGPDDFDLAQSIIDSGYINKV
jgi:phosphoglycerate dehydrogenase-like enzyme/CMP-N-acetylneuraminic acid synthetase